MKTRAPQLHLEYRFYRMLQTGNAGEFLNSLILIAILSKILFAEWKAESSER